MNDLLDIVRRHRRGPMRLGLSSAALAFGYTAYTENPVQSAREAIEQTTYIARQDERAREAGGIAFTELYNLSGPGDDEHRDRWQRMVREARLEDCSETISGEERVEVTEGIWGSDPSTGCISGIERAAGSVAAMRSSRSEAVRDLKAIAIATLGAPLALLSIFVFVLWLSTPFRKSGGNS